jgi:hypothetical protein
MSSDIHPLLTEELLKIKAPLQRDVPSTKSTINATSLPLPNDIPKEEEEFNNPTLVDAFGSLSISLSGGVKYYGHIANSWVRDFNLPHSSDD